MTFSVRLVVLLGVLLAAMMTLAENVAAADASAHQVVRDATQQVMDVVVEADAYADENPERYRVIDAAQSLARVQAQVGKTIADFLGPKR